MKTHLYASLALPLVLAAATGFSQIPNSDFESWTVIGFYEEPLPWGTPNMTCSGPFYPVTKSTDHYPAAIGSYSMRIENDTALAAVYCGLGSAGTGQYPLTKFPITGHPDSLTGYYKFLPQNGDTMTIQIRLYNGATNVSGGALQTAATASSWTPFNIAFSAYATADSAEIFVGAFCICGAANVPYGNSVLYVDNLNFDNLITGIEAEKVADMHVSVYPNPASSQVTLQSGQVLKDAMLSVYNVFGQQVIQVRNITGRAYTLDCGSLPGGLYSFHLTQNGTMYLSERVMLAGK